jgi:hypothetical protein
MSLRISELTESGALLGDEMLELSRPSTSVKLTATTISAQASDNSFNDSADGFVAEGFAVGDSVRVDGFTGNTANNIGSGRVTALTAGKMTIGGTDGDVIVDDAAGESVTITRLESRRTTARALNRAAVTALSISSGVVNIDCALGDYFTLALNANVTSITFSNLPASGFGASKWLLITQDSTPRTVAWPASFKWAGGSAGAVSTGSGAKDALAITSLDGGTTWLATLAKAFA